MSRGNDHALLHVMVVGFHHKKGCQIEYAYPPFDGVEEEFTPALNGASEATASNDATTSMTQPSTNGASAASETSSTNLRSSFSFEMPADWRRLLPSLALPDGAHHWNNDAVFFTLPFEDAANSPFGGSTSLSSATVFGISCCRQIDAKELTKNDEITRNTVQKSICVLTSIPAYGLAEALLKPVTQAYFEQKDFERKEIIKELFQQLANSLTLQLPNSPSTPPRSALAYMQEDSQLFIGLSARDFVLRFRHSFLLLVKLVLLEKKVLFFGPPSKTVSLSARFICDMAYNVNVVVSLLISNLIYPIYLSSSFQNVYALSGETILTLLSLFPKMIEDGLYFSCEVPSEEDAEVDDGKHGRNYREEDDDDDDDVGLSLKSGAQSLSEDFLVVTHRQPKAECDQADGADDVRPTSNPGDVSDIAAPHDSGLEDRNCEKDADERMETADGEAPAMETSLSAPLMTMTTAEETAASQGRTFFVLSTSLAQIGCVGILHQFPSCSFYGGKKERNKERNKERKKVRKNERK